MFELSNLRKESKDGWTYLKCDFDVTEIENPFKEKTIWIAVEDKNSDMLADNVYDSFVLVPLYLAMYYKQDLHIKGNMSLRLYRNIEHYLMKILDNFSNYTHPIHFTVDGFDTVQIGGGGTERLIGTGISCGVDSLTTIYDNFVQTKDENFRINSLFFLNCGTHGRYENKETKKIWLDRAKLNKKAADELGLPMYLVDSNIHAYIFDVGVLKLGHLAIYSCILALQRSIKRYLISSAISYDEIMEYSHQSHDSSLAEYSESYMVPLISTEKIELVIDGCQYTRTEKTERISEWNIAQKYLNVCLQPLEGGKNCSCCSKCMRTLLALDAMGKLDKFKNVFNIETYHKKNRYYKYKFLYYEKKDANSASLIKYLEKYNFKLPSKNFIYIKYHIHDFIFRALRKIKKIINNKKQNV